MEALKNYTDFVQEEVIAENENEGFKVTDLGSAEWCAKRIAWHKKKIEEATAFVEAEKEKLDRYLKDVIAEHDSSIDYFTGKLRPYAEEALQGGKKKTLSLPSANLSFKKSTDLLNKDHEKLLRFVKRSAPEYVKVKEEVDWAGFKKTLLKLDDGRFVTEYGEIVEGVTFEERPDNFTVVVK